MTIHHLLKDFGIPHASSDIQQTDVAENELLDSFEQGYKAGWEDAVRAKSEERTSISVDLARSLQDLSFTYHEARAAVLADLTPVLEQIVMKIVPKVAQETLGLQIVEQLTELAETEEAQGVTISVSPENQEAVSALLPEKLPFPVNVHERSDLSEGQCEFRFGLRERRIDFDETIQGLSQVMAGLVHETRKEVVNG